VIAKKIILNRIKCLHCGDIITSYNTHDFKECSCKKVSVDGGLSYLRRGFHEPSDYEDLSLNEDSTFEVIRENLHWGTSGKSGNEPLRYIPISQMTNEHIMNILRKTEQGGNKIRKFLAMEWEYRKQNNILIEDNE